MLKNTAIFSLGALTLTFIWACSSADIDPITEPPASRYNEPGKIIVKGFGACGFCHGETGDSSSVLSGGRTFNDKYGEVKASNITPSKNSGIRDWSSMDFVHLFRSFQNRKNNRISNDLHKGFEWLSDNDIFAITAYLKGLPPVENNVDGRSINFVERNTAGFFEVDREVAGHVPEIDKSYPVQRRE